MIFLLRELVFHLGIWSEYWENLVQISHSSRTFTKKETFSAKEFGNFDQVHSIEKIFLCKNDVYDM